MERQTAIQVVVQAIRRPVVAGNAEIGHHRCGQLSRGLPAVGLPDGTQPLDVLRPLGPRELVDHVDRLVIGATLLGRLWAMLVYRRPQTP